MFTEAQHIFFVGIKGVAMANIARIFAHMGKRVSGSDTSEAFITDGVLEELDISVIPTFDAEELPQDVDLVIYSAAHGGKGNPQVQEALERQTPVVHQAMLLGQFMNMFETSIAVTGCHGKTTTTAMLSYALSKLTHEVSYLVGAPSFSGLPGSYYGDSQYFVIEADEYGIDPPDDCTPKFHLLHPDFAIITNIDHDHPDVYQTLEDIKKSYEKFAHIVLQKQNILPQLILCHDDAHVRDLIKALPKSSYVTYGHSTSSDVVISKEDSNSSGSTFQISSEKLGLKNTIFHTELYGEKNILNAVATIIVLLQLGFIASDINASLKGFTGVKRRFEYVGESQGALIFDDYAHHPSEIKATIQATHERFPGRRIILIFQPHTYSRTEMFKDEFVNALLCADATILLPIFSSAREIASQFDISSEEIARIGEKKSPDKIIAVQSPDEALLKLEKMMKDKDIVFTMGAGDVYELAHDIIEQNR